MQIHNPWRIALLAAIGWASTAQAESISVAVASNFTAPMQAIGTAFAQDTGHQALLSFGATGKFYAQIHHGAPFGMLLAADDTTPVKLAQQGLADATTRFTYAIGTLALWSPQNGYVDVDGHVLKNKVWQHIAMANPKVAPYGRAAEQTLGQLGLLASIQPKVVRGENIGQTYQFTATGNAQLGFVALSQIMQNGHITHGSAWIVPAHLHAPIRQDAIVLNTAKHNPAAAALVQYLKGDKARRIMAAYGYSF